MTPSEHCRAQLNADEKIEPLGDGYVIIQSASGYRFGADAVALSKFACEYIKPDMRVADLCSGCGVVGLLVNKSAGCAVDGAELDTALSDMSNRAAAMNGQTNVRFYNADVRALDGAIFKVGAYDAVTVNPPYFKADSKPRKTAPTANSELTLKLGEMLDAAQKLLKSGGAMFAVYTSTRLDEMLSECRARRLMPKLLVIGKNSKTFLLRCVKHGKPGLDVRQSE